MRFASTTLAILTLLLCSNTFAQGQPRENVMAQGTVKAVRPGYIAVVTEQGQQRVLKVPERPENVSFVGSAMQSWLRPNMLVKFKNTFDAKGRAVAVVNQLEVVSLRPALQLGVIPDSRIASGGAGLFSNDEPTKRASAPQTKSFTVAGRLRGLKNNTMLVAAGPTVVQSQLSEKASISVDLTDYSLAREGDTIRFSGWYYLGQPDKIVATRLSITAKEKLGIVDSNDKKAAEDDKPKSPADVEKALEDLFAS